MRVLLLRRQSLGGIATHTDDLAAVLGRMGFGAVVEDAESWIPNDTKLETDRKVSKEMKRMGEGFDIVHAFGYRAAWACAEAYGHREAWLYTAYDMPKTTHKLLVDKLNEAQVGICTSRELRRELEDANVGDLRVVTPGVRAPIDDLPSKEIARETIGISKEELVVVGMGRLVAERGFDALVQAMDEVWREYSDTTLILAGVGPEEENLMAAIKASTHPNKVMLKGRLQRPKEILIAADLVVVPSRRGSFSLVAAEAMALEQPVLLRRTGGLPEMIEEDFSGLLFTDDESLGKSIVDALSMPLTRETIGSAAKNRARDYFDMEQCAEDIAQMYRDVLN